MRYSHLVLGLLGAATGSFLGLFVSRWIDTSTLLCVAVGAVVGALVAVCIHRMVLVLLATIIFATVAGVSYFGYSVSTDQYKQLIENIREKAPGINLRSDTEEQEKTEIPDSEFARKLAELIKQNELDSEAEADTAPHQRAIGSLKTLWQELCLSASANKTMLIACVIVGAIVGLTLACLLKRMIMAICCSVVGTTAIMVGAIAVLLSADKAILTKINEKPTVAPAIFIIMIAIGWLMQMISAKAPTAKATVSDDEETES